MQHGLSVKVSVSEFLLKQRVGSPSSLRLTTGQICLHARQVGVLNQSSVSDR